MRREDYSNIDRRLALAYGLLTLCLMLGVMAATGWYFHKAMEREQNRLAGLVTNVLADSLGQVSFSGTHRLRLLIGELQEKYQGVAYIQVLDTQGKVAAKSGDREDAVGGFWDDEQFFAALLEQPGVKQSRRLVQGEDRVREVGIAYRGGFDNQLQGILLLGISESGTHYALVSGVRNVLLLLISLLALSMMAIYHISRRFAEPVRRLAHERAEGQQRLSYVLDAIDCAIWEWDLVSGEVILDEHWAAMLGYRLEELEPITPEVARDLAHPEDLAKIHTWIRAHLEGKTERYINESRARHKNGNWVWVRDNGVVIERDENGRPVRMIGARQDITDRIQVEQAAMKESERFRALIKASDTGVWEWDSELQGLWCSDEYFGMLGFDKKAFAGSADLSLVWEQLLHPDDRAEASRRFAEYLAGDTSKLYESEFRMRHADGGWVWISSRGRTLVDADGKPTGLTVGAHINISSLKEVQASLQESQQRLQAISDSIPGSMVYRLGCGKNGEQRQFIYVSRGVERLYGLTVEEALADAGNLYRQVIKGGEEVRAKEAKSIQSMKSFRSEVQCLGPDGQLRWILLTSRPQRLASGDLVFDGIAMDITTLKQQEREILELNMSLEKRVEERTAELSATLDNLQRAQDELLQSEKLASLGALVAGVAHELNTPIGNALMVATSFEFACKQLDTALQGGLTRSALQGFLDEVREGSQIIERNLARSSELIGSFKQLAVDQTSYQRRPFELKALGREVLTTLQPTLRKTPYVLHEDLCSDVRLDSYPGPLGQVLINLINNALIHAFIGREHGSIRLECRRGTDTVQVIVADDGIGIDPELQKKIFDPFYTTQLGQGGSGLGLHIVYTLVTGLLGGRIEIQSTPDNGSRFILDLPLVAPQHSPVE